MREINKVLFLILFLLFGAGGIASARTFVLVLGISNYGDENLNLQQTSRDAYAFFDVMQKETPDVSLLTSSNCNYDNVLAKLENMCSLATENDQIIFYFSGHGTDGGVLLHGGTLLEFDTLLSAFRKSKAKAKFAFIDACHAGSVYNLPNGNTAGIDKNTLDSGCLFFVGCRNDEVSRESSYIGAGYFTRSLILGLRGKADLDQNNEITAMELMTFVYTDVMHRTQEKQHPQLIGSSKLHDSVLLRIDKPLQNDSKREKTPATQFDTKIKIYHRNN